MPSVSSSTASARPKPPQLPLPKSQIPTQWEISSLLSSLGVPARLSGFYYLVDAILYLLCQPIETRCMTIESTQPLAAIQHVAAGGRTRVFARPSTNRGRSRTFRFTVPCRGGIPRRMKRAPTTCEFVANVLMFLRIHLAELKK